MGPLLLLSGPTASGKTTLLARLLADQTLPLRLSVSVTTRPPRPGEEDGKHYHFWDRERFEKAVNADAFLEWAEVYGNLYGTLKSEVEPYRRRGLAVLLEIDVNGWEQVKHHCPEVIAIFLRASSLDVYEERLRKRKTENEAAIQRRLDRVKAELARAPEYDYQVINDDLESAVVQLRNIVKKHLSKDAGKGPERADLDG
jgi:guanylate kinase